MRRSRRQTWPWHHFGPAGDWERRRAGRRPSGRGLYRSRRGKIFGVFKGLADYLDLSVKWIRIAAVILLFVSGFWPMIGLYLLAALIMKPEPVMPLKSAEDEEFYDSYVRSRSQTLDRLKRTFENLDRRIRRMEDVVTTRDFDWEERLNKGT